jgi:hypothetical protein
MMVCVRWLCDDGLCEVVVMMDLFVWLCDELFLVIGMRGTRFPGWSVSFSSCSASIIIIIQARDYVLLL